MPLKRRRTPDEIDILADEFRPLWRDGDVVRPWLRKHGGRLSALIADGWSWAGVATALTQAGITYRTKRPWTVNALKAEVSRASAPSKSRKSISRQMVEDACRAETFSAAKPIMSETRCLQERAAVLPMFAPASLKPYEPPRALTPDEESEIQTMRERIFKSL